MYNNNEETNNKFTDEIIDMNNSSEKEVIRPKKNHLLRNFTKLTASALVFGLVAGASFQGYYYLTNQTTSNSTVTNKQTNSVLTTSSGTDETSVITAKNGTTSGDVSEVVTNVMPSIVSITCKSTVNSNDIFGRTFSNEATASGSGIIIGENDTSVLIVTNNHVVEGASGVEITFSDESTAPATIKGTESASDLAVVSVDLKDLSEKTKSSIKIATLGNSNEVKTGEQAIAIGNALGYGQSVTVGYISALNREVKLQNGTMTLLQTDAAINPGNSGGALLNAKGEVIGINSVKYASDEVEGMGYAIPISNAVPIINQLMNKEVIPESEKAVLGVKGQDVTDVTSESFNMPIGVYIGEVEKGSAAEKAGLKVGEIIVSVDDRKIDSMTTLKEVLSYYKVGDTIKMTVKILDNGSYKDKNVELTF